MKKISLVLALGLLANFSYGQWGLAWEDQDSIPHSKPVAPILEISNKQEFDSIRLAAHMGFFKYKVYHYDSIQKIQRVEHFDEFPRILNEEYLRCSRYVLIGDNGEKLQMIELLPDDPGL